MADADKRIDELMGTMTLEDKVGQCLTLNFTGYTITDYEKRFINELRCGGMRITPHITGVNDDYDIRKPAPHVTPAEYTAVMKELQEIAMERNGVALHLVTDQEGDLSIDFVRGGLNLFPSNMGMAATNDPELVKQAFLVVARQLRAHGISWIHSPELDVNINPRNPEVGMRAFSDDPQICADYGLACMQGLLAGGIIPTAKHYPGRGDSEVDAHNSLDVLRVDRERLDAVELLPYRELIKAGIPAVMTAHNAFTALDDETVPASVSYKITHELLREELGFEGVITTDAIGMQGLLAYCNGQAGATVMAIKAGADLVLVKEDEKTSADCYYTLLEAVKSGDISEERIDQSVKRILTAKARVDVLDNPFPDPNKVQAVLDDPENKAICVKTFEQGAIQVRDKDGLLPLTPETKVLAIEPYIPLYHEKGNDAHYHAGMFREFMKVHGGENVKTMETEGLCSEEDVNTMQARSADADVIVFFNVFWRGSASNRPLIRKALELGKKVVVASNDLYDSYFLREAGTIVVTFGAVPGGTKTAADIIYGTSKPGGTWPLRLIKQDDLVPEGEVVDHAVGGHFNYEEATGKKL